MCKAFEDLAEKRANERVLEEKRDAAVRDSLYKDSLQRGLIK